MKPRSLALTCNLFDRETPTSFASRLAKRNRYGSANDFCLDVGLDWSAIIRGNAGEIYRLADLAKVSGSELQRYAIRTVSTSRFRIGRETGTISTIHRTHTRVCPDCIADAYDQHGAPGLFRRADWQLVSVRACEMHSRPLIRLPTERYTKGNYDTAALILQHLDHLRDTGNAEASTSPTDLERYLRSRLARRRGKEWIDRLALGVVSRCSEMLGARIMFGPDAKASELSEQMLHDAGSVGFDVLRRGPDALRRCLVMLKQGNLESDGYHTHDLGVFFYWLTASRSPKEMRPIRRIVRDFVVDHYPLDPGRVILGHVIHRPKLLSLREASRRLRIRQVRVRSLCAAAKILVRENPASLSENDFRDLVCYMDRFAAFKEAAAWVGCSFTQLARLEELGMITQHEVEPGVRRFLWTELRGFTKWIEELPVRDESAQLRSLWKTCNMLKCTVAEVYGMIQSGRLTSAARSAGSANFTALLMDPNEVRDHLVLGIPQDPHLKEAAVKLRSNGRTIHYLARHGFLKVQKLRHPSSRNMRSYVDRHSLEQFLEEHITIGLLAEALDTVAGPLVNHLNKMQIEPVLAAPRISRIYDREVVQARLAVPGEFGTRL